MVAIGMFFTYRYKEILPQSLFPYKIYHSILFGSIVLFLIIPLYISLIEIIQTVLDRYPVLLKFNHRKEWWKQKNISLAIFSIIFTVSINSIVLGVILLGSTSLISYAFLTYMFLGVLFQLVGFQILGVFCYITVFQTGRKYIGFFVTFSVIVFLQALKHGLRLNFNTLEEYMFLIYKYKSNNLEVVPMDFAPLIWLTLLYISIYFIGYHVVRHKDLFWSE